MRESLGIFQVPYCLDLSNKGNSVFIVEVEVLLDFEFTPGTEPKVFLQGRKGTVTSLNFVQFHDRLKVSLQLWGWNGEFAGRVGYNDTSNADEVDRVVQEALANVGNEEHR